MAPSSNHPHRTNLDALTTVSLPGPRAVTFDFHSISPNILLTIPTGSKWDSLPHWHTTASACERLLIPSRPDHIGPRAVISRSINPGMVETNYLGRHCEGYPSSEKVIRPLERVYWKPYSERKHGDQRHDLIAYLGTVDPEYAQRLYRNVAGVTLDAEVYPRLQTTPAWIRWWYWILGISPFLQRWFARALLGLQLSVVYRANDFLGCSLLAEDWMDLVLAERPSEMGPKVREEDVRCRLNRIDANRRVCRKIPLRHETRV